MEPQTIQMLWKEHIFHTVQLFQLQNSILENGLWAGGLSFLLSFIRKNPHRDSVRSTGTDPMMSQ